MRAVNTCLTLGVALYRGAPARRRGTDRQHAGFLRGLLRERACEVRQSRQGFRRDGELTAPPVCWLVGQSVVSDI